MSSAHAPCKVLRNVRRTSLPIETEVRTILCNRVAIPLTEQLLEPVVVVTSRGWATEGYTPSVSTELNEGEVGWLRDNFDPVSV